jgi:lipid-A-disaccharide synthase
MAKSKADLFIFAGEKSGDLHGAHLVAALKKYSICGVGGEKMREQNFECLIPMEEFQVMGFIDVFLQLSRLFLLFRKTLRHILEVNPKAVVTIDYPGFNLRLAKALRKRGYKGKILHYICPSVWAWGKKRIPLMANVLDGLFSILPFERNCFKNTSLPVHFVGHPLVSGIAKHEYHAMEKIDVALFPGSRKKEIERNLPLMLKAAKQIEEELGNLQFAISCSNSCFLQLLHRCIDEAGWKHVPIIEAKHSYDLMKSVRLAIAKSGTVTLELALHEVPTVVTYAISKPDLFIVRDLLKIRLPYYALPNILAEKEVFPELFGPNFTITALVRHAKILLTDEERKLQVQSECRKIAEQLTTLDTHQETARLIETYVK